MWAWLFSGVWFAAFFGLSYFLQPRTHSVNGKVVAGGVLILLSMVFVASYITLFSTVGGGTLLALLGIGFGIGAAEARKHRAQEEVVRRLLEHPEYQDFYTRAVHLYRKITERALENAKGAEGSP